MIFYFTGTGNSLQVARSIASHNEEELIAISLLMHKNESTYEYTLDSNEKIGFIFPVYAWGPPRMVLDFIKKLKFNNFSNNYTFAIATCGENIGGSMKTLSNHLKKKNIVLHSGFSVVMPNNYMLMGMDVDSKEESNKKLSELNNQLIHINKVLENNQKNVFQLEKGTMPAILTTIINPLFTKFSINTKKFYAKDNCISCGICEMVCNTKTITVTDKPTWGTKCTQCLACINLCPVRAIEYGKGTEKRGRYKNPNIAIEDLEI